MGLVKQKETISSIHTSFESYARSAEMALRLSSAHADVQKLVNTISAGDEYETQAKSIAAILDQIEKDLENILSSHDIFADERKSYEKIHEYLRRYKSSFEKLREAASITTIENSFQQLNREFQTVLILRGETRAKSYASSLRDFKSSLQNFMVTFAVSLVFLLIVTLVVIRGVRRPLRELLDRFKDLVRGEGDLTKLLELKAIDCAKVRNCNHPECPCYGQEAHCWYEAGSYAAEIVCPRVTSGKIASCDECEVCKEAIVTEIDEIASFVNAFITRIRYLVLRVSHQSSEVASSAMELAATAKQQEAIMGTQVKSTDKVVNSVKDISDVTEDLVQTMQGVASGQQGTTEFTNNNEQTDLTRMKQAMHQMEDASKAISNRLEAINEKAENITTVVTTITKVADQTNLLSLNAAIEAEKAGEYGRGFTVVAREIRRLADQTALATLDIEQMVKEMQSAVASGVMEMDKFIAEVRRSVEDVEKISTKLALIINQVQALSPSFEEVNLAMAHLSEETQETKASLHETYSAIGLLNEAAKGLQNEVLRFKVN